MYLRIHPCRSPDTVKTAVPRSMRVIAIYQQSAFADPALRNYTGQMCFKITGALREYYRYSGVSAELERLGYGSSRPELAWANRQKERKNDRPIEDQSKRADRTSAVKE